MSKFIVIGLKENQWNIVHAQLDKAIENAKKVKRPWSREHKDKMSDLEEIMMDIADQMEGVTVEMVEG